MKYQIDQSGKIEQTEKPTVLAYTNKFTHSLLIPAKVKRQLQEAFRKCGMTKLYIQYIFSAAIFLLVRDLKQKCDITIDKEYPGKENIISDILRKILVSHNKPAHRIDFARIGNRPKVHYAAHDVYIKKVSPDKTLTLNEIVKTLKKTDGRLRECLSTLVDAQSRPLKKMYHRKPKKSIIKK